MKCTFLTIATFLAICVATAGQAVTLTHSVGFYRDAATLEFSLAGAPHSNGTGGRLDIHLNGDFSAGATVAESALLRFVGVSGEARLRNANSVDVNTISGLSHSGFSATSGRNPDDVNITFSFTLTGALLDDILRGQSAGLTVQTASGVNLMAQQDLDFVSYALIYNGIVAVPLPAGLPLLLSTLGGVAVLRRCRRKAQMFGGRPWARASPAPVCSGVRTHR